MKTFKLLPLLILFVAAFSACDTEPEVVPQEIVLQHYTNSNSSLPNDNINDIAVDNTGVVWVATEEGLASIDGSTITVYNTQNSDLQSNIIKSIVFDNDNNLWLGTYPGGLYKKSGAEWTLYNSENTPFTSNYVGSVEVDNDGNIWTSYASTLYKYDGTTWSEFSSNNQFTENVSFTYGNSRIIFDDENNIYASSDKGLVKFDGTNWSIYNTSNSNIFANDIAEIVFDQSDNIWCAHTFTEKIEMFDGTTWSTYSQQSRAIFCDTNGKVWSGNGVHLIRFNSNSWVQIDETDNSDFMAYPLCFANDNDGHLWIGTANGIYKMKENI